MIPQNSRQCTFDKERTTNFIQGKTIWDITRIPDRKNTRIEFPYLRRFKDHWYCGFREAYNHNNHPSGRARIIRSADGVQWDTVALFTWDGGDVREPKLSITAEGWLMMNTSVYFVSKEPRAVDKPGAPVAFIPPEAKEELNRPDLYFQLDKPGFPPNDVEANVAQQSMTWLSPDGTHWGSAHACPTGVNSWRWDVTWHNGMGYSIAYAGKDQDGKLYRTRDGKNWRVLKDAFLPGESSSEGALAFGADDTAYCVLRGSSRTIAYIGIGKPPYYQEWEWKRPKVDYGPAAGGLRPIEEMLGTVIGGPTLLRLSDGRLVAAGRALGPGRDDGHVTLFWVDPRQGTLTMFAEFAGTSYPGLAEHDGMLWVTYISSACHRNQWEVHLAKVKVPGQGRQ